MATQYLIGTVFSSLPSHCLLPVHFAEVSTTTNIGQLFLTMLPVLPLRPSSCATINSGLNPKHAKGTDRPGPRRRITCSWPPCAHSVDILGPRTASSRSAQSAHFAAPDDVTLTREMRHGRTAVQSSCQTRTWEERWQRTRHQTFLDKKVPGFPE
jgi:hypothetical protein